MHIRVSLVEMIFEIAGVTAIRSLNENLDVKCLDVKSQIFSYTVGLFSMFIDLIYLQ